jgi:hypothetical protein
VERSVSSSDLPLGRFCQRIFAKPHYSELMNGHIVCTECRRSRGAYEDATVKYMRFHHGTQQKEEGQRLFKQMNKAKNAFAAHEQDHASRN